jgi:hypothetical protein
MYILAISYAMSKHTKKHTYKYRNNKAIKREKCRYGIDLPNSVTGGKFD